MFHIEVKAYLLLWLNTQISQFECKKKFLPLTVPRERAPWISSSPSIGHQHSAMRQRWVMSRLNMFIVW